VSRASTADTDAAAQQLLAEASSAPPNTVQPSAVLGANLLNAARIDHPRSSPAGMARKSGAGKLKPVSTPNIPQSRQNLARKVRDPYDIEVSPVKGGTFTFPDRVNPKPLRIVKSKKVGGAHQKAQHVASDPAPSSNGAQQADTFEPDPEPDNADEQPKREPSSASQLLSSPPGKDRKTVADASEGNAHERRAVRRSHPEVQIPVREKSKRIASREGGATVRHPPVTMSEASTAPKRERPSRQTEMNATSTNQQPASKKQKTARSSKPPRKARYEIMIGSQDVRDADNAETDDGEGRGHELDDEEGGASQQAYEASGIRDIHPVFKFAHLDERFGVCQTNIGVKIRRLCDRSRALVQNEDISLDTLSKTTDDIRKRLHYIDTIVEEDERGAFRGDAYAYLFRSLILYLEAVCDWFERWDDIGIESVDATRLLYRLIHEILGFKDVITGWKVPVPQRYKGDRVIMDVHSNMIVPLRQVEKTLRLQFLQSDTEERHRRRLAELRQKAKEEQEEEQRRAEVVTAKRERWKRWQDLHIVRMECEPLPLRRRQLWICTPDEMEEKDANGQEFERVPVFKPRTIFSLRWALALSEKQEWADEAAVALLEGLQRFSGMSLSKSSSST
jgi:hypothetical protein